MVDLKGKRIALCVTVYNHRYDCLLSHLGEIRSDIDIYIVTQENDPALHEYDKYKTTDNIYTWVTDATSIFEKREKIRQAVSEWGYDYYIMIDDDVHFKGYKITEESKRTTSCSYKRQLITFAELLDKCIETMLNGTAGFVSPDITTYIGMQKPGKLGINKGIHCSQFVMVDIHQIDKADIHYDTTGDVHEDIDFIYKLLSNSIECITIKDYGFDLCNLRFTKEVNLSSIYNTTEELYMFVLNQYVKWHWPMSLTSQDFLVMRVPYRHLWGQTYYPEADNELLRLCNNKDVNGVIEYLKQRKYKK